MKKLFLLLAALGLLAGPAGAQTLDPTFQATVLKTAFVGGLQTGPQVLAVQPDGKALVAGGFDFAGNVLASKLTRLNADGTRDATFNVGGTGANGFIAGMAVQPDGKILLVGGFSAYNGTPQLSQARLNADGTLDASFAGLTVAGLHQLATVAVQPDGKVLVGGVASLGAAVLPAVARLQANGTPDAGFTPPPSVASDFVRAILVQPDGKILVGGNGPSLPNGLLRLNPDGTTDPSLQAGISANSIVYSLVRQPDGKLLAGGQLAQSSTAMQAGVVRLLATGALDNTFSTNTGFNGTVRTLVLQASGSLVVGGTFTTIGGTARGRLARLLPSGDLDNTFATGTGANNVVLALAATTSGQLLAAGNFTQADGGSARTGLTRLTAAGTDDATFTPAVLEGRGSISRAAQLANGQLLVMGNFATFNGAAAPGGSTTVRRVNANGSLDASYSTTAFTLLGAQPDGTFFSLGYSTSGTQYTLLRNLPSGTLDASFANPAFSFVQGTTTSLLQPQVVRQPDGKLLVYGTFTTFGGVSRNSLVRLNADGTVDNSFVPPAGTPRQVFSLVLQASGKVVLTYAEIPNGPYSNTTGNLLQRLNTDGTPNNTFNAGGGGPAPGTYSTLLPLPDGRLLLTGVGTYNGQVIPYNLGRLTADGTLDNTLNQVAGYYAVQAVQPDGKLLVTNNGLGSSTTYGATQLLRLTTTGSVEGTFAPVPTPQAVFTGDNLYSGFLYQPTDGTILTYGSFTSVLGQLRVGLARLVPGVLTATAAPAAAQGLLVYPNPARQQLTVALPALAPGAQATLLSLTGQVVRQWPLPATHPEATLDLSAVGPGLYVLRLPGTTGFYQQKVVVAP